MEQNEAAQVSLLDEIKDNASLIKELIQKAEENKHEKELVDNSLVAMKSNGNSGQDPVKEQKEDDDELDPSLFDSMESILNGIKEGLLSFCDAFNLTLQKKTGKDDYYVEEELDMMADHYCTGNGIDKDKLVASLISYMEQEEKA